MRCKRRSTIPWLPELGFLIRWVSIHFLQDLPLLLEILEVYFLHLLRNLLVYHIPKPLLGLSFVGSLHHCFILLYLLKLAKSDGLGCSCDGGIRGLWRHLTFYLLPLMVLILARLVLSVAIKLGKRAHVWFLYFLGGSLGWVHPSIGEQGCLILHHIV